MSFLRSDPLLGEVPSPLFPADTPFVSLPARIDPCDAQDAESLRAAFERVFFCPEARSCRNVVFIWVVQTPYRHSVGRYCESNIVYVEKTKHSIFSRWSNHYPLLVSGSLSTDESASKGLRTLARQDNLQFYTRLIREHGPMRIWWSDVATLNAASNRQLVKAREWECVILENYWHRHECLPLKNRRR